MFLLLGGCLSASSFAASRYSLASPEGLLFCLRLSASAPLPTTVPLSLLLSPFRPSTKSTLLLFHVGLIHAPIGKAGLLQQLLTARSAVVGYDAQPPARCSQCVGIRRVSLVSLGRVRVSGLGICCRNYWPGQESYVLNDTASA